MNKKRYKRKVYKMNNPSLFNFDTCVVLINYCFWITANNCIVNALL